MGMKRLVFVLALVLLPAAGAATPTVVGPGTIGAYRFEQPRGRAIDLFGPPTYSRNSPPLFHCLTTWRSLGLHVQYSGPCSSPGRARRAELEGREWRTREGLRVGDTVAKLRQIYRGARRTSPDEAALQRLGIALRGIEWDLRRARPASSVIVVTQGTRVVSFELRPASLRSG
jgi:hypothetical protein